MKRISALLKTDFGIAFVIAVIWQGAMTLIGGSIAPEQGVLGHMSHWDTGWYKHVITHGYTEQGSPAAPAFYPLFPLLIHALSVLTFGMLSQEFIALFINTAALGFGIVALMRIVAHFKASRQQQLIAIAALLCFPSAFFLHTFYTEALFIALAFWAYLFALQRKWWAMGILLAILTTSRLPSVLFVALCGLEYLRSYNWNIRQALNKNILWLLLAPLGFIAYGLFLLGVRGDFFAMFGAYKATNDWTYQIFNPNIIQTFYETGVKIAGSVTGGGFNYEIFINYALPLACIAALLVASVYLFRVRKNEVVPLSLFGVLSVVLFTLNSNVVSVHRYTLVCLSLFIALAIFNSQRQRIILTYAVLTASLLVQLFLYSRFIEGVFAG